ncbi:MAG: hypothetical protein Q4C47_06030 [Planctomycetia bacterium]|nr:hypothetical protein [Planctomycetia bacterium]
MGTTRWIRDVLRKAPIPFRLVTTCGGDFLRELLETPGISGILREVVVPYSPESMTEYLGFPVEHASSERTARQLAVRAACTRRHEKFSGTNPPETTGKSDETGVCGLAAVASLVSDRPKRGEHRVDVAYASEREVRVFHVTLTKGKRDRASEDRLAGELLALALATAAGVIESPPEGAWRYPASFERSEDTGELRTLDETESLTSRGVVAPDPWRRLWRGEIPYIWCTIPEHGAWRWEEPDERKTPERTLVFPGSWNPLHRGHRTMMRIAEEKTGMRGVYECAIRNVDKPPLDYLEVADRLRHFEAGSQVILSGLATFDEKSQYLRGSTFIVGADTCRRLVDVRYHGNSEQERDRTLERMIDRNCGFLIFGRVEPGDPAVPGRHFDDLRNPAVPEILRRHSEFIPESEFRDDISSTELRRSAIGNS